MNDNQYVIVREAFYWLDIVQFSELYR